MSREDVEARLLALSTADRNLLRMYNQLPTEEVMKQALQFGEYLKFLEPNERNSNERAAEKAKKYMEFSKQLVLYNLMFAVKHFGLPIPRNGGGKPRRHMKRGTRKLKR